MASKFFQFQILRKIENGAKLKVGLWTTILEESVKWNEVQEKLKILL